MRTELWIYVDLQEQDWVPMYLDSAYVGSDFHSTSLLSAGHPGNYLDLKLQMPVLLDKKLL